jgi:hypothetical protein
MFKGAILGAVSPSSDPYSFDKVDEELTVPGPTINPESGKKAAARRRGLS